MTILLTGYTGNVGPEIARQLAPHRVLALVRDVQAVPQMEHVTLVEGSLEALPEAIRGDVQVIVHAAAEVAFKRSLEDLRRTNVDGTAAMLEYARRCPRLERFIHISTVCVCGDQTGFAPEAPVAGMPGFVNPYEQSKWEAERIVLGSGLPVEVVRLAIVAGSERDGTVRRPGALHHALYWLYKGLIPMIPGSPGTCVDLISTEFAAGVVAAVLRAPAQVGRIIHASTGTTGPRLDELLDFLAAYFSKYERGWSSGAVTKPDIVDRETFALFEQSVKQSGDLLFQHVCADANSFLPILLYPRTMETSLAASVARAPWQELAQQVVGRLIHTAWSRKPQSLSAHATS